MFRQRCDCFKGGKSSRLAAARREPGKRQYTGSLQLRETPVFSTTAELEQRGSFLHVSDLVKDLTVPVALVLTHFHVVLEEQRKKHYLLLQVIYHPAI